MSNAPSVVVSELPATSDLFVGHAMLNVEATLNLAVEGGIPVIASGGVTNIEDIRALSKVANQGILGAITGRAIYEGTLDVAEAQTLADELTGN